MIAWLRGRIQRRTEGRVVVDVGGVGYELEVSARTLDQIPLGSGEIELEVLTLFRTDSLQLYGFGDELERELFRILVGISGVGPKLALAVLSCLSPASLSRAVEAEDTEPLQRVPGVGKKTAQRLLLELRGKLSGLGILAGEREGDAELGGPSSIARDAISALMNMGYRRNEAEPAVMQSSTQDGEPDLSSLIRGALRRLVKR